MYLRQLDFIEPYRIICDAQNDVMLESMPVEFPYAGAASIPHADETNISEGAPYNAAHDSVKMVMDSADGRRRDAN